MLKPCSLTPLVAALLVSGCAESARTPVEATRSAGQVALRSGTPGAAADRMLYQVILAPLGESQSHGVAQIEIVGGYIAVTVHASGVMPNHNIPQHIHLNPTCANGGGVLLDLDAHLTVPGEGASVGAAYPMSNQAGVVNYHASRSLTDLLAAVNTYQSAGLSSVDELIGWLNLEDRNVHQHVAEGPPFPAVNCGEVERLN